MKCCIFFVVLIAVCVLFLQISLDHIRKADVVAQTKIVYKEKELLQLMYDHLLQVTYIIIGTSVNFLLFLRV